jgi:hypothetical protein
MNAAAANRTYLCLSRPRFQIQREELRGDVIAGVPEILARLGLLLEVGDAIVVVDLHSP